MPRASRPFVPMSRRPEAEGRLLAAAGPLRPPRANLLLDRLSYYTQKSKLSGGRCSSIAAPGPRRDHRPDAGMEEASRPMADLAGKTLFITGASRGIGKAIALRAAADGANVVIAAKTAEPNPKLPGTIHTAAAEVEAAGGKALACLVDVRFEDQIRAAVVRTVATFGGIDVLVNNASAISLT